MTTQKKQNKRSMKQKIQDTIVAYYELSEILEAYSQNGNRNEMVINDLKLLLNAKDEQMNALTKKLYAKSTKPKKARSKKANPTEDEELLILEDVVE